MYQELVRKVCFKCKIEKELSEFYKHKEMADGHLNKCKECAKKDVNERYIKDFDKIQRYEKKRAKLEHRIKLRRKAVESGKYKYMKQTYQNNYRNKYPEKYKAKNILNNAIRDGKIIKQPCKICGDIKSEGHHEDYSKPLDVIWLCDKHHKKEHEKLKDKIYDI